MFKGTSIVTALVITSALAALAAQPATAQTASNVICNGCVDSKDIKNRSIRRKDLRINAVNGLKVLDGSLTSADIADGTVSETDLDYDPTTQAEHDAHAADSDAHHVPTVDTTLDQAGIEAFGFVTGPHTVNTDTLAGLGCTTDQIARWNGSSWQCADESVADLQAQLDNLALLVSRQASAFIFVSSSQHNGNLGGIANADVMCNDLAFAARLPGEYKAWLATSAADDPESTFFRHTGAYILPNGDLVANDWADLIDGSSHPNPVDVDENGTEGVVAFAVTNVNQDGTATGSDDCGDWMSSSVSDFGVVGSVGTTGSLWTNNGVTRSCSINDFRLYCVGQ